MNPKTSELICDIFSSKLHMMCGISPCLTASRASAGGHWILSQGRLMSVAEMECLQGVGVQPPNGGKIVCINRPSGVSQRQWGLLIGNSISVSVLQRVLCRLLPAAGLSKPLVDLWGQ